MIQVVIEYVDATVTIEVDPRVGGDAAAVARRLRSDGLAVQRRGMVVYVNGQGPLPRQR